VTRAEIEEIRGVELSRGTLDTLLELGWIQPKGRRRTPGRPVTWVTTAAFFDHFSLEGRESLPGIEELRAAGLLETGPGFSVLGGRSAVAPTTEGASAPPEERLDEEALVAGLPLEDADEQVAEPSDTRSA
jgi:segregation and condensation protein B